MHCINHAHNLAIQCDIVDSHGRVTVHKARPLDRGSVGARIPCHGLGERAERWGRVVNHDVICLKGQPKQAENIINLNVHEGTNKDGGHSKQVERVGKQANGDSTELRCAHKPSPPPIALNKGTSLTSSSSRHSPAPLQPSTDKKYLSPS